MMCGYVFVSSRYEKTSPINPKILQHRGPDYTEEIELSWCRFRHWRLSIQDLSPHSNQPYSDDNYHLIYNGELYDYRELGSCLFSETFDSDTQLLFHALKNDSFGSIKNESGFYSFVFVRELQKQFFAARDYFGKKPLYFYFDEDLLVIASEDRAVRHIANEYGKDVTLNKHSIAHYLRYKDLHFGSTFFHEIKEIPPGSTLDFDFKNWKLLQNLTWENYYNSRPFYKAEPLEVPSTQDFLRQLRQQLLHSIKKRFNSDVPVQLALSGGVDSSLLALVAINEEKNFERALTVSSSSRPSELYKSKKLCEEFQLSQKVIDFDAIDVLDILQKAIQAQGGPLSHPHALAVFALTYETSNKGKVLITGEGADELMYGYDHYKNGNSAFAFREHVPIVDYFDAESSNSFDSLMDLSWHQYLGNNDFRDLDIKTHLLSLLKRNDRISMQNSVEVRSAFLDSQLFQFVNCLQDNGTLSKGKDVLLDVVVEYYGDYKQDKNKIGFYVPFDDWFETAKNKNVMLNAYVERAKAFFKFNYNWTLKSHVEVEGKLAWALLNIGMFLELEDVTHT